MRASTYLHVAEKRAENVLDLSADLFKMAQGKPVYSPSEPQAVLGYIVRDTQKVYNLTEAVLARTDDPYLRDKAHDQSAKAVRAMKSAEHDIDAAEENYFENVELYITP